MLRKTHLAPTVSTAGVCRSTPPALAPPASAAEHRPCSQKDSWRPPRAPPAFAGQHHRRCKKHRLCP
eukprot:4941261-Alexandrium_andersonii.AAC.1